MSSYINHPHHFNSLKDSIKLGMSGYGSDCYWSAVYHLEHVHGEIDKGYDSYKTVMVSIIEELQILQIRCVNLQYKGFSTGDAEADTITDIMSAVNYKGSEILEAPEIYNCLSCVLYQIEIGHLEKIRPLTEREKLALKIAELIKTGIASWFMNSRTEKLRWSIDPENSRGVVSLIG